MNSSRRQFLKSLIGLGAGLLTLRAGAVVSKSGTKRVVILHTNDTHSQVEPLPSNHPKFPGEGGYAARAALVRKIRTEGYPVLLFDSGDYFQGTPYYNMYNGDVEISLMNSMNYTAVTVGNHEFDKGLDNLNRNYDMAAFDIVSSNYLFQHSGLKSKVLPYKVYSFDKVKIGVFGLGINPDGLISPENLADTRYADPVQKAAETAHLLKKELKCSMVVCLSHLGYKTDEGNIGDYDLARQSKNIDMILGGHSHTLLTKPVTVMNSDSRPVIITQNAYAGVQMSRIDCYFSKSGEKLFVDDYTKKVFNKQV